MTQWTQTKTLIVCLIGLMGTTAMAQSKATQLQCRTKAKETAKIAYDQCLSVAKDDEAENIRKEYKTKLAKLKDYYEQKLRKLNIKTKAQSRTAPALSMPNEINTVLPQKSINTAVTSESTDSSYSTPNPVNTTETVIPQAGPATNDATPLDPNEPTIRLKEIPPASNRNDRLESEPELAI